MLILVVDDAAPSRYLLARAVEQLGHDCTSAADGLEAWRLFQEHTFDVVISDWLMPGIDGDELCRRIREDADARYTYFIMLSSLEDKEHVLRGMEAGADDYLTKPLDRHDLQMRLIAATRVTTLHHQLVAQQRVIEKEVELAAGIQRGLLPARPPEVPGVALAGRCLPAANVGGDYYDFLVDAEGRLTLLIADVAGHSIGSALLVAMARSVLRREVADGHSPGRTLAATAQSMYSDLVHAELFITVFAARYDPAKRRLTYAGAGHNPPLMVRSGELSELEASGPAVGFFETPEYDEVTLELAPGDALLLYTDGVVEATDESGEQFGEERLRALLKPPAPSDPGALTDAIMAAVRRHTGGVPAQDDITLAGLSVREH
jgi:sigma-B regulation protein RsbU (phosphoserine phosphatase)